MINTPSIYCPICFNDSLHLKDSGKINVYFNGRLNESAQCLFNLETSKVEELENKVTEILTQYFKWYSGFQNREPVKSIEIVSIDYKCDHGCVIPADSKISVVGVIFTDDFYKNIIRDLAQAYSLELNS